MASSFDSELRRIALKRSILKVVNAHVAGWSIAIFCELKQSNLDMMMKTSFAGLCLQATVLSIGILAAAFLIPTPSSGT